MFSWVSGIFQRGKKESSKSLNNIKGMLVSEPLTEEIIDHTSDDELPFKIFENLAVKLQNAKGDDTFLNLSTSQQTFYAVWLLEAEVNNGGFNQYYYNSGGRFAKFTPEALEQMGAKHFANLMARTNQVYISENNKITEHLDGTLEGFSKSYHNNPLNELDEEFYRLYSTEDLQTLQVEFIRNHKKEFINT